MLEINAAVLTKSRIYCRIEEGLPVEFSHLNFPTDPLFLLEKIVIDYEKWHCDVMSCEKLASLSFSDCLE